LKDSLGKQFHETLSCKNKSQKRAGEVAPGVDPEFKPKYRERERERENREKRGRERK
jgi:hypothetical protein